MATCTWKSDAATGNAGTAGNYEEGAAPANGDYVYYTKGSVNVNAGLNQSGVAPAAVYVGSGYTGTVGNSAADPLVWGATTTLDIRLGANASSPTNACYIKTGNLTSCYVDTANILQTIDVSSSGTVTGAEFRSGLVTVEAGTWSNITANGKNSGSSPDDNLFVQFVSPTVTLLHVTRGNWSMTGAGTLTAVHNHSENNVADVQAGTVTTYYIINGTIQHKTTSTCTKAWIYGGSLDCSLDLRAKTFTDVAKGALGEFISHPNITVTNGTKNLIAQAISYYGAEAV